MKRILTTIICVILCFTTVACKCKKNEPIKLEEAQYGSEGEFIEFTSYDSVQEKIDNKSNFALYIKASGCLSCAQFAPYITEYVEDRKIVMYMMEFSLFDKNNSEIGELLRTPSVLIFKDGELYEYIAYHIEDHASYFMSTEGFKEWFESYVIFEDAE